MPAGAEVVNGGVHFRVWSPEHQQIDVILEDGGRSLPLERESTGYFSGFHAGVAAGALYRYRINGPDTYPDPVSRFQPEGPHKPSQVIDPDQFSWTDSGWRGVALTGQVIYEIHVGTFTPEGTWEAAAAKLQFLRDTGISVIEVMPVSEFPGQFGWGYDGVHPFAPTRLYGTPDDFRKFVDRAHALGIGVILDVVYNHFGPDGNYFGQFSNHYFTNRHKTDWGAAINFDSADCGPVRDLVVANAEYWIREFHLDGLRLDATQNIYDDSKDHILAALARAARKAAGSRQIIIVAENEPQEVKLIRSPEEGGYGLDMLWNDDYHHSAMIALTGHNEAYYSDYRGSPQEFISAMKYGYLYQGQWYRWQGKRRGTSSFGVPPASFVTFMQNHDQIANSARGQRCRELSDPGTFKAITALTLLGPGTPMLFQGQEFATDAPFYYFADHTPELSQLVREGRMEFMSQFVTMATPEMSGCLPDPGDRSTFESSKVDWSELEKHRPVYQLHRDLLRLRKEDPVLRAQKPGGVDGAVLSTSAFVLRYFGGKAGDRLLVVNLGMDLNFDPAPEPLLAPMDERGWDVLWSSELPSYGGCGTPPIETEQNWWIPGRSAILLKPGRRPEKLPDRPMTQDETK
jgi:maltooligosyltrehalose trehalohydrolase